MGYDRPMPGSFEAHVTAFVTVALAAVSSACTPAPARTRSEAIATTISPTESAPTADGTTPAAPEGAREHATESAAPTSPLAADLRDAAISEGGAREDLAPFDGSRASPLGPVVVQDCRAPGGPVGAGHATLTFATSGEVREVVIDSPPFAGTPVGACVAAKLRAIRVAPFAGGPVRIGKSFVIQ